MGCTGHLGRTGLGDGQLNKVGSCGGESNLHRLRATAEEKIKYYPETRKYYFLNSSEQVITAYTVL